MLDGKRVVLGVTGSIAAVECIRLSHELRRRGAEVYGVMSGSSRQIIHPYSLEFATGNDVITEITGDVEHVELCGELTSEFEGWRKENADLLLIAPATANTIGKIANGVDDTPVTTFATTAIGSSLPIVIAPAMHEPMYGHPGVDDNLEKLKNWGINIISPVVEEDKAKLPSIDSIATECQRALSESSLEGKRVVITSGSTAESIDPVRIITTRSSGKTGRALAKEAYIRGAEVVLIHNYDGYIGYADEIKVESANEMIESSIEEVKKGCDLFISAAAVSDYTIKPREKKIKSGQDLTLKMEKVPKLLEKVREQVHDAFIVGFKAETGVSKQKLIKKAKKFKERSDLDLVVGNDAEVMGKDSSDIVIVTGDDVEKAKGKKEDIAVNILDIIEQNI